MDAGREDRDFCGIYAVKLTEKDDTDPKANEFNTTAVQLFHMPCLKECNLAHRKTKASLSYCFSPKKASKYW